MPGTAIFETIWAVPWKRALSHKRISEILASMCICAASPESVLFAHVSNRSRGHFIQRIRHMPLLPAGKQRWDNVTSTSTQRHDVASTLIRCCTNVMCLLGAKDSGMRTELLIRWKFGRAFLLRPDPFNYHVIFSYNNNEALGNHCCFLMPRYCYNKKRKKWFRIRVLFEIVVHLTKMLKTTHGINGFILCVQITWLLTLDSVQLLA